jgi:hypothetical protein
MKVYKDIVQGTIEWHELKWGKIGGTLSKGLFVDSDTLLIDILSQRLEDFEPTDSFENDAMQRGNELEPFAREYLQSYTGIQFNEVGWLQNSENELLGISPDGISECERFSCEIKCLSRKAHYSILLENEIPLDKIHQCVHYFTVNPKLEKHYFIAFRPEAPKHFIKELTLENVVNIGTKARPKLMTIEAIRDYSIERANVLLTEIINKENELKW